jgi:hypothetical protein
MELVLDLDDETYHRLERRAQNYGFESTEAYSITVLQTVMDELEEDPDTGEVEQRLEDLGYLS